MVLGKWNFGLFGIFECIEKRFIYGKKFGGELMFCVDKVKYVEK